MVYSRAAYTVDDPTTNKNLLADGDCTTRKVTILSGQVLVSGSVIGKVTASGKYILSASAAVDGSQTPDMVLARDIDATSGDVEAIAYETGVVVATALTLGTGHTIASIREGLRVKGLVIDD